jgi:DMSO/TMAO reductase YedYZ molybdopterin-dependent catalytic subunit
MAVEQPHGITRRRWLKVLAAGGAALGLSSWSRLYAAMQDDAARRLPSFTGPGANPYWNSVGPIATYPQKLPLILLTDRPVQLETPREFFLSAITPNKAFSVRWHLDEIPSSVDLSEWRLRVEGNVEKPLALSMADLLSRFKPVSVTCVNQCSGNSRSRFQPRVPGGQWGHGRISRVEVSTDSGKTWHEATLGEDLGPSSFRTWEHRNLTEAELKKGALESPPAKPSGK